MVIATHIIKIRGMFDENIFKEEKELRDLIDDKIKNEIDRVWHPDLELFKIDGNKIEVWVYISASMYMIERKIIEKWLKDHIKEGITVEDFELENLAGECEEKKFFALTP